MLIAQNIPLPLGNQCYHILDRLEIKTGVPAPFHSSLKAYSRKDVVDYAYAVDSSLSKISFRDRMDIYYIFKENNDFLHAPVLVTDNEENFRKEYIDSNKIFYSAIPTPAEASYQSDQYIESKKPFLKYFYKSPANMYEVNTKHFNLRLNPVFNFQLAKEREDKELIFKNQRGGNVRGSIDGKVYFSFSLLESQARFPGYVHRRINKHKAIPGAGLYKTYKSTIFDITNGYDFLNAQGLIGFNLTSHIGVQFGHGNNFIGNGYRSLLLSDFSNDYLYLKINTRVWKFHYQNLFGELAANSFADADSTHNVKRKYFAGHFMSFNLLPNLNFGFYEVTVFSRDNGRFDFQYLNPVILYRTIEHSIDSPDNILIGLDAKWNFLNKFQLYGQFMLDEFKFDELFIKKRGWWANKYGLQTGLKYIDAFGVDHLDLQLERNVVRPYTYTHRNDNIISNYTHYNTPLAHPLGANFKEEIVLIKYQPIKKLFIDFRYIHANFGEDSTGTNVGSDILLPNTSRDHDYGNEIGQGIKTTTHLAGLDISYQIRHGVFFNLQYFYRKKQSEIPERNDIDNYFGGGIRVNIAQQRMDF